MDKCVDATVAPDGSMRAASASAPLPQAASDVRPISMTTVIVRVLAEAGPTAACRRSGVSRVIRPSEASAPETARAHHRPGHFAFLASGAVWLSFAFFLLTTMAFGILQNFAPAILSHVYGVSLIVASGGLTAYLVGSWSAGCGFPEGSCRSDSGTGARIRRSHGRRACVGRDAISGVMAADGRPRIRRRLRRARPRPVGATRRDVPVGPQLVRSGVRVRLFRSGAGQALSPLVFGPVLDAGHFRRPLVAIALLQAAALLTALRVSSRVRSVEPLGVRTAPFDPETGRAQAP